jgi:hypothetical protein
LRLQVVQSSKLSAPLALTASTSRPSVGRPVAFIVTPAAASFFAANATDTFGLYYGFQEDTTAVGAAEASRTGPARAIPAAFTVNYTTYGPKTARLRLYDADPSAGGSAVFNVVAETMLAFQVSV